jgi:hypothetical protein
MLIHKNPHCGLPHYKKPIEYLFLVIRRSQMSMQLLLFLIPLHGTRHRRGHLRPANTQVVSPPTMKRLFVPRIVIHKIQFPQLLFQYDPQTSQTYLLLSCLKRPGLKLPLLFSILRHRSALLSQSLPYRNRYLPLISTFLIFQLNLVMIPTANPSYLYITLQMSDPRLVVSARATIIRAMAMILTW